MSRGAEVLAVAVRAGRGHARLLGSLVLWVRGRRDGVPPGAVALPYGRDTRAVGLALLVVCLAEVVLVELVVPWHGVRIGLLVLGVWTVLVALAGLADLVVRPHVLTDDALLLRVGGRAEVRLPLSAVVAVRRRLRSADGTVVVQGEELALSPGDTTCVELTLSAPRAVQAGSRSGSVRAVRFSVDDAAAAVALLSAALLPAARRPGAPPDRAGAGGDAGAGGQALARSD